MTHELIDLLKVASKRKQNALDWIASLNPSVSPEIDAERRDTINMIMLGYVEYVFEVNALKVTELGQRAWAEKERKDADRGTLVLR